MPGASVARVARAHGVNANQVFAWRRQYRQGLLGSEKKEVPGLLAVRVAEAGMHCQQRACQPEPALARFRSSCRKGRCDSRVR